MEHLLENEELKVSLCEKGAQLCSLKSKSEEIEYIWTGDPKYWARHAPILFPIVGKVVGNQYKIGERSFAMSQHGFARDQRFSLVEKCENFALFKLLWDEVTLESYPYRFELTVGYKLDGNKVIIEYTVANCDSQTILFSIGAHPGFNCPLLAGEVMEDYYFEFENYETCSVNLIDSEGYLLHERVQFLENQNRIPISSKLFEKDALIFDHLNSKKISIKSLKNTHEITVDFGGFPLLGLWSKPTGAPFVCIEPWFGHADYWDFTGDFREKAGLIRLPENETFACSFSIAIH